MTNQLDTWVKFNQITESHGVFEMGPLVRGMGLTVGNSLRRVILSSLEGVAPTMFKIENVTHEFDTMDGIQEDILDIIFNLKNIVFSVFDGDPIRQLTLDVSGKNEAMASDFKCPPDVQILTPDVKVASLTTKDSSLKLTLTIERGIGYRPLEAQNKENTDISTIFLDSSFSPIDRVNHVIEDTRIGQDLNYDKLVLDIWTNGSVTAEECVKSASSQFMDLLSLFGELNRRPMFEDVNVENDISDSDESNKALDLSVDDLELSARSLNCLKKADIKTIGELVKKDINELNGIKNFGKKSADEINSKLKEYNLTLNLGANE